MKCAVRRKGNFIKTINNAKIIGIDHGYGNMKTSNHCFPSGVLAFDAEPLFTGDMLTYNGRYYLIGEGHKEFVAEKVNVEDYYILTLAAIAKELKVENLTEAHIVITAGLPLTWTSGQKADFKAYLSKNAEVEFVYKKTAYHIYIVRIAENACGLSPNQTDGQTVSRGSNMFVPDTVPVNVPFVQWTAYCLMNLWCSSFPTLPMRTANTLKTAQSESIRYFQLIAE